MGMFLGQIEGPQSEEAFADGFSQQIQPSLLEYSINVEAWVDPGRHYYIQGYRDEQEIAPGLIENIISPLGWFARMTFFRNPFGLPSRTAVMLICDMPYNIHPVQGAAHKKCLAGHHITNNHNIAYCPVTSCGQILS